MHFFWQNILHINTKRNCLCPGLPDFNLKTYWSNIFSWIKVTIWHFQNYLISWVKLQRCASLWGSQPNTPHLSSSFFFIFFFLISKPWKHKLKSASSYYIHLHQDFPSQSSLHKWLGWAISGFSFHTRKSPDCIFFPPKTRVWDVQLFDVLTL